MTANPDFLTLVEVAGPALAAEYTLDAIQFIADKAGADFATTVEAITNGAGAARRNFDALMALNVKAVRAVLAGA